MRNPKPVADYYTAVLSLSGLTNGVTTLIPGTEFTPLAGKYMIRFYVTGQVVWTVQPTYSQVRALIYADGANASSGSIRDSLSRGDATQNWGTATHVLYVETDGSTTYDGRVYINTSGGTITSRNTLCTMEIYKLN